MKLRIIKIATCLTSSLCLTICCAWLLAAACTWGMGVDAEVEALTYGLKGVLFLLASVVSYGVAMLLEIEEERREEHVRTEPSPVEQGYW